MKLLQFAFNEPRQILNIKILLVLPIISLILCACENDIEKVKIISSKSDLPVESTLNATLIYSDSAELQVKLIAPQLDRFLGDRPYIELPKGVELEFYEGGTEVSSRLTANYAISYEEEGIMEAKGNVILVNALGEQLNTEHLIWDEKTGKIHSEEFVKITTADEIIMGEGFESNQNFTQFKIKKIKGTINIEN